VCASSDRGRSFARRAAQAGALTLALLTSLLVALASPTASQAKSRIKDLVAFEGVRDNDLLGYGLVGGLNGTGDTLRNAPFTEQTIQSMLDRLGINVRNQSLRTRNIAAVLVTANLPPFMNVGGKIDITVSSMGDATSLLGGRRAEQRDGSARGRDETGDEAQEGRLTCAVFAQDHRAGSWREGERSVFDGGEGAVGVKWRYGDGAVHFGAAGG